MLYETAEAYLAAPRKAVALFGMSGVGKSRTARMLREAGSWFHYSVDYRIGTRYMGEHIADNFKRVAMQVPFLRELLMSDSVHITSNLTFENLAPLSTYLGKPGDPDKGGIPFEDYLGRQRQHREAEVSATLDTAHFFDRAESIYGYPHFLCDTSGSLCEVVDPDNAEDPVLSALSRASLLVQIRDTDKLVEELTRRFDRAPKPMYYPEAYLCESWSSYLGTYDLEERDVDPDDFIRWGFRRLIAHRRPKYDAIAQRWGISVAADDIASVRDPQDFDALIAGRLPRGS